MKNERWILDPIHSELSFKIRHLMISNASGHFRDFHVEAETPGDDFSKASIRLTAKVANLVTHDEKRDAHLRSADFFDAENFPDLNFVSTSIETTDDGNYTVHGDLTMKGVTRQVSLIAEYGGIAKNGTGPEVAGFSVSAEINRMDWGISFNRILDNGGLGLAEKVKVAAEIRLVKQTTPPLS